MKHAVVAAFVVLSLLGIGVKNSDGSALGLADGTYNINIDFFLDSFDVSGTITIGPSPSLVTSFHAGVLDCTGCDIGSSTPDSVEENNGVDFRILDTDSLLLVTLSSDGSAFATFKCPIEITCNFSGGEWNARTVPEPMSSLLLLSGIGVLGVLRLQKKF